MHGAKYNTLDGTIELNTGKKRCRVTVVNTGDRAIQVGSHYHLFEANPALEFDREATYGMHLNIPAGTAIRFEPGQTKTVDAVAYGGTREAHGFANLVDGPLDDPEVHARAIQRLYDQGFRVGGPAAEQDSAPVTITRAHYASLYGPTVGDQLQLADTNLVVEITTDLTVATGPNGLLYGDESVYGGGKAIRDGMAQSGRATRAGGHTSGGADGTPDTVITAAIIIDPVLATTPNPESPTGEYGIVKADVGIKDGKIIAIGKAGNPDLQDGITPSLTIGAGTEVIAGEHRILTPGGIDTHIHYICPQQAWEGLANGITTFVGGGTGPAEGTKGTTCTPGAYHIEKMIEAAEGLPVNTGFLGKGSTTSVDAIREQIHAGACGMKIHEDWGATPATIRAAMAVCDELDVQLAIHTDTLNESGFFDDTKAAIDSGTIHTFHSEGAGGGHAPDILRVTGMPNVLPASTNPTLPYSINSVDELLDMVMVCHHLSHAVPEDVAFADSRVRAATIAAETVLHDRGVISIFSSDSQAMGRVGESWARAFQTAHHCKAQLGPLPEDEPSADSTRPNDNFRILRYVAKITVNPARAAGISDYVGQLTPGHFADAVLWPIAAVGAKPDLVLRSGTIAYAPMGDPNASLPTPQPVVYRDMFGNTGAALQRTRLTFVSQAAADAGIKDRLGLVSQVLPVRNCRTIGKADMLLNDAAPEVTVDPETYEVRADGDVVTIEPAESLPLTQLFYLA